MLEDKLTRSKQKSAKSVSILLAAIAVLLVLGGLFVAELVFNPDNSEGQAQDAQVAKSTVPASEARLPSAGVQGGEKLPSLTSTDSDQLDQAGSLSMEEERASFKSMLSVYESEIKDSVEAPEFAVWDVSSQEQFLKAKQQILSDFADGEYVRARDNLAELIRQATKEIGERDAAVEKSVQQTKIALNEMTPQKASIHFSRALELAPHSAEVLALESRVVALPQVVDLVEQAQQERVQGDAISELATWKKIASIDPARSEAKHRIATIENRLFQQELSFHLQQVMAAIEARQPTKAQKSLDKARKMAPDRDEVVHLQREINTLAKELRYAELIRQAKVLEAKDDWSGVLSTYNDAARINPSSAEVENGITRAQSVLGIRSAINEQLSKPYRLSTKVGERQARELLQRAGGGIEISPSTVKLAQKLERLLHIYTTPVKVHITSDGKTFVQVKGVGKVGKVIEKIIQIRPGRYVFEGKREGFVSKATTVDIPPSGEPAVVHVVCENRI